MRYFIDKDNNRFAFTDEQIDSGHSIGFTEVDSFEDATVSDKYIISDKISILESKLARPVRELLSSLTSREDKIYAQNKIDAIEKQISELRLELRKY